MRFTDFLVILYDFAGMLRKICAKAAILDKMLDGQPFLWDNSKYGAVLISPTHATL